MCFNNLDILTNIIHYVNMHTIIKSFELSKNWQDVIANSSALDNIIKKKLYRGELLTNILLIDNHIITKNKMIKILIKKGYNINSTNGQGQTALMNMTRHIECVKLLIENGCDIKRIDYNGMTALSFAAKYGHKECLKLLIEKGCDVNCINYEKMTPLMFAVEIEHIECAKIGETVLMCASIYGYEDCIEILIKNGGNVHIKDNRAETALVHALRCGHAYCAEILIKYGCNIYEKDNNGKDALMHASCNKHNYSMQTFIEKYK